MTFIRASHTQGGTYVMATTYTSKIGTLFKIGQSGDVVKRLNFLRTGNPQITLICCGNGVSESELHKTYHNNRVDGEWFALSKSELHQVVQDITKGAGKIYRKYGWMESKCKASEIRWRPRRQCPN